MDTLAADPHPETEFLIVSHQKLDNGRDVVTSIRLSEEDPGGQLVASLLNNGLRTGQIDDMLYIAKAMVMIGDRAVRTIEKYLAENSKNN